MTLSPERARRLRRTGTGVLALSCASLALVNCGGGGGGADPGNDRVGAVGAAGQQIANGATLSATSPLTGEDLDGDAAARPVLAVKVDNSASSAPQVGLGDADLVTEELVEGGITRLAVFYQSRQPQRVGPVRSMRATDIGVVSPLGATLVASGGAAQTVRRVHDSGIKAMVEGAPGFSRASDRTAPYNLFVDMHTLAGKVAAARPAAAYLPFGSTPLPGGTPARGLSARFSPSSTTSFDYADGHYVNTDSNALEGDRFLPATVVVLRVQVGDAGYLDPAGNRVPETKLVGSGPAMVFHGGRMVKGTWSKADLTSRIELTAGQGAGGGADGGALQLPPGRVWLELVPAAGGGVSVTR